MKRRKNNNNTLTKIEQPQVDNVNNKNNKRNLIIRFSNNGKIYLMNHILHKKKEPFFIITKSVNQYSNIKSQTSDEIQPLKKYENRTFVFDDMLLSKQESTIDLFFTRGRHSNIDMF